MSDAGFESNYAAKTAALGDLQFCDLMISTDVYEDGEISFMRKVSTQESHDVLQFYIDAQVVDTWSGELDWLLVSFPVSAGNHTFKWRYLKDASNTAGDDCAWIDTVVFPLIMENSVANPELTPPTEILQNFPNPFTVSGRSRAPATEIYFSVASENVESTEIKIYNVRGQKVKKLIITTDQLHDGMVSWDGTDSENSAVSSGVYLYRLLADDKPVAQKKMMIIK